MADPGSFVWPRPELEWPLDDAGLLELAGRHRATVQAYDADRVAQYKCRPSALSWTQPFDGSEATLKFGAGTRHARSLDSAVISYDDAMHRVVS